MQFLENLEQWCTGKPKTKRQFEEVWNLAPEGYEAGMLTGYTKTDTEGKPAFFEDCKNCRTVYAWVDIMELCQFDDNEQMFQVRMKLNLRWLDPNLRLKCSLHTGTEERIGYVDVLTTDGTVKLSFFDRPPVAETMKLPRGRKLHIFAADGMKNHFFPHHTLEAGNVEYKEEEYEFSWSDRRGTFVNWTARMTVTLVDRFQYQAFPFDRQICRISIHATRPVEEFQFVVQELSDSDATLAIPSRCCRLWSCDRDLGVMSYVEYEDVQCPATSLHGSKMNCLLHIQREGTHFLSVWSYIFLANFVAMSAFISPMVDTSSRLKLAVVSFIITFCIVQFLNDFRAKCKTAADKYITFAYLFPILICLETLIVGLWYSRRIDHLYHGLELRENASGPSVLLQIEQEHDELDSVEQAAMYRLGFMWVVPNMYIYWCLTSSAVRPSWSDVYTQKKEPYAPTEECTVCRHRWRHYSQRERQRCLWCQADQDHVRLLYLTPKDLQKPLLQKHELPIGPGEDSIDQ